MQTTNPTTARPQSRTRRRLGFVAACTAVALVAGVGVKFWHDQRVPPPDADPERVSRYMASPAFAALSDAEQAPYLAAFQGAIDRGALTPEQQRDVISNPNGEDPIERYFTLPPGRERVKFLDDVIDRVLKSEKEASLPRPQDNEGAREIRFDGGVLADTVPPEDRARRGPFLQDLHDRRAARGVPDDGKFLFR